MNLSPPLNLTWSSKFERKDLLFAMLFTLLLLRKDLLFALLFTLLTLRKEIKLRSKKLLLKALFSLIVLSFH